MVTRPSRMMTRPSRMVLSKTVARPLPVTRNNFRAGRLAVAGPFGGMNRTIPPPPEKLLRSKPKLAPRTSREDSSKSVAVRRKALKMQSQLASVSYDQRTRIKSSIADVHLWDQFDLLPDVKEAITSEVLRGMVDTKPTPVQRLAIPALLGQKSSMFRQRAKDGARQDFLIAAETGSGKTLAYLIPAINAMKLAEAQDPDIQAYRRRVEAEREKPISQRGVHSEEPHPTMSRPRVIVLVPSAELVDQIGHVSKLISHRVKFKSDLISASIAPKIIRRNLYDHRGIDLVISTPQILASIADADPNILSCVSHLIIDEADSLFDRDFAPITTSIVDRAMPSLKQFILCSATIPQRLDNFLAARFQDMMRIVTPNLHAIPRRVQLSVVNISREPYRNNRDLACADAIYSIGREASRVVGPDADLMDVRRILVFVNERGKTHELAEYLVSKGIDAIALNRDSRRSDVFDSFTAAEPLRIPPPTTSGAPKGRRSLDNARVIVATDLMSRGIDTLAVRHVILYDVPHGTIDFIHRLGRAGRMGRRGRAIVLVGNDDRRDIVAEVKESMFMGQALI